MTLFTSASLRVFGIPQQHDELNRRLKARASDSHLRGEKICDPPFLKDKKWPNDAWILTAPTSGAMSIDSQLRWIISRAKNQAGYLRGLAKRGGAVDIACTCISQERSVALQIEPSVLTALSKLGLRVTIKVVSIADLWKGA